jgi:hypothetical protein
MQLSNSIVINNSLHKFVIKHVISVVALSKDTEEFIREETEVRTVNRIRVR